MKIFLIAFLMVSCFDRKYTVTVDGDSKVVSSCQIDDGVMKYVTDLTVHYVVCNDQGCACSLEYKDDQND